MTRPALLLDRDGVINIDHGYVCTPERTEFVDGIFELVRTANQHHDVVIITNQAGIARGYYSEQEFETYMSWMQGRFEEQGARIDGIYYCPHHPTHGVGPYLKTCECRKPRPGMIIRAAAERKLDLSSSIFVGDSESDMQAAAAAGVKKRFLLRSDSENAECPLAQKVSGLVVVEAFLRGLHA